MKMMIATVLAFGGAAVGSGAKPGKDLANLSCGRPQAQGTNSFAVILLELRTEHLHEPLGIDRSSPRLSWQLEWLVNPPDHGARGLRQTSYDVKVCRLKASTCTAVVWESGVVHTTETVVTYSGQPLLSAATYLWSVTAVGVTASGAAATATACSKFTMGLLGPSPFSAPFIGMATSDENAFPWFRSSFRLPPAPSSPASALLFVASIGYHEAYVNGQRVTDTKVVLAPSVSFLPKRVVHP